MPFPKEKNNLEYGELGLEPEEIYPVVNIVNTTVNSKKIIWMVRAVVDQESGKVALDLLVVATQMILTVMLWMVQRWDLRVDYNEVVPKRETKKGAIGDSKKSQVKEESVRQRKAGEDLKRLAKELRIVPMVPAARKVDACQIANNETVKDGACQMIAVTIHDTAANMDLRPPPTHGDINATRIVAVSDVNDSKRKQSSICKRR